MIVFYLIISPLFFYAAKIFNFSLTLCILYVFIIYVLTRNLSRLNLHQHFTTLNMYLLNNRIIQYLVFYALTFENLLLSYPIFSFLFFLALPTSLLVVCTFRRILTRAFTG